MKDCVKCVSCDDDLYAAKGVQSFPHTVSCCLKYKRGSPEPDCPGFLPKYEFLSENGKRVIDNARERAAASAEKPPYCAEGNFCEKKCHLGCCLRPRALLAVKENGGYIIPRLDQIYKTKSGGEYVQVQENGKWVKKPFEH
jgi:hypothetical protein